MTKIEWTDAVWNPIVGCEKVSAACKNCYAIPMAHRLAGIKASAKKYEGITAKTEGGKINFTGKVRLDDESLLKPLQWKKGRKIFVNSMGDLFHKDVPFEWLDKVFAVMALCPQHTFQILTKRSARMREYFDSRIKDDEYSPVNNCGFCMRETERYISKALIEIASKSLENYEFLTKHRSGVIHIYKGGWANQLFVYRERNIKSIFPLKNVWLGVTVENQATANERVPHLLACPGKVRFLSCEPLLENIALGERHIKYDQFGNEVKAFSNYLEVGIDWVIVGGESGRGARPTHPDWVLSIRDQCTQAGVPFFFKQWGVNAPLTQIEADSFDFPSCDFLMNEFSEVLSTNNTETHRGRYVGFARLGKGKAGRKLDGIEYNGMPNTEDAWEATTAKLCDRSQIQFIHKFAVGDEVYVWCRESTASAPFAKRIITSLLPTLKHGITTYALNEVVQTGKATFSGSGIVENFVDYFSGRISFYEPIAEYLLYKLGDTIPILNTSLTLDLVDFDL